MSTELQVFENVDFGVIRSLLIDNEPWFVAVDVCKSLELSDTGKALSRIDWEDGRRIEIDHPQSPNKKIEAYVVNESGLYSLVLGSRKPEARAFKRWVTHEVIPSIRKTGSYSMKPYEDMLGDPEFAIATFTALRDERNRVKQLEAEAEKNQPLIDFAEHVTKGTDDCIDIGCMAKFAANENIKIGEYRLFRFLRDNNILMRGNLPYQKYINMGYFTVKETTYTTKYGNSRIGHQTLVTGKGQQFIIELLRENYGKPILALSE